MGDGDADAEGLLVGAGVDVEVVLSAIFDVV